MRAAGGVRAAGLLLALIVETFGSPPTLDFLNSPVIVDNRGT